jgi:hypothetical protein
MNTDKCPFCPECIFVVGLPSRFCSIADVGEPDDIHKMDSCPLVYPGREQSDEPTGPCYVSQAR